MIGLFGGTFDPVHEGHILLARVALVRYSFRHIYLVPARKNPNKSNEPSATPEDRFEMLRRAVAETGDSRLKLLDWEIKSKEPSYTLHTVRRLMEQEKGNVTLIMGNEVFSQLPSWHQPKELASNVNFIIVMREGSSGYDPKVCLEKLGIQDVAPSPGGKMRMRYLNGERWIDRLDMVTLPVSATRMRECLLTHSRSAEDPPQGIQRSVWGYIKEKRLYTVNDTVGS